MHAGKDYDAKTMTLERFGFIGMDKKCFWGMVGVEWLTPLKVNQIKPGKGNGYKFCAKEHQTCKCTGTIKYGKGKKWVKKAAKKSGSTPCSNGYFGDPIYGIVKDCYCSA